MVKWEYHILRADWYSSGLMLQSPATKKLVQLEVELARLGEEGWEAITIQHAPMMPTGSKLVVLMKRPKE